MKLRATALPQGSISIVSYDPLPPPPPPPESMLVWVGGRYVLSAADIPTLIRGREEIGIIPTLLTLIVPFERSRWSRHRGNVRFFAVRSPQFAVRVMNRAVRNKEEKTKSVTWRRSLLIQYPLYRFLHNVVPCMNDTACREDAFLKCFAIARPRSKCT